MTGPAHDPGHEPSAFRPPNGGSRERARPSDGSLARISSETTDNATLIQDAQSLLESFAGRDAAVLLASVTELCRLLVSRGSARRAELLLRQMLPIGEQHLDRDHVALGHVIHELAHICLRDARYADAEPLLLRLYYMQCRRCGKDHPDAAAVLASLARVRQALGQHDEAEAMWRQVIAVCEQTLGSQHVATTTAVERLAESCAARGKVREAGQLRAQASAMREAWVMRALPAPTARIVASDSPEPDVPVPDLLERPGVPRPSLIVLPSSGGALTIEEQPVPATAVAAQDALRAIDEELRASGAAGEKGRGGRRWSTLIAAAAVLALLGGLTASGAASTFATRPDDGAPTWAAGGGAAPASPRIDSTTAAHSGDSLYGVRLASEPEEKAVPPDAPPILPARLIGPVPRLPLPETLSDRRIDGGVAVRFRVDAHGVPDTTTIDVVRTPHELLTDVVRRAIPDLRFTPARATTPGAPGQPDVVEMTFGFSRVVP